MGILTKNKPELAAATVQSQPLVDSPRVADAPCDSATHHVASPAPTDVDPLRTAKLPPPAPCPTCGSPILWLDVYRRGWQCPGSNLEPATCSPPPIAALVLARAILVDEGTPEQPQPAWHRLQTLEHHDRRSGKRSREFTTTPFPRPSDGDDDSTTLADQKNSSQNGTSNPRFPQPNFFIDESLGKIFSHAEMDGQFGNHARPTGRVIYRSVDDWWDTSIGDPEKLAKEIESYETFVKPNLGKKVS